MFYSITTLPRLLAAAVIFAAPLQAALPAYHAVKDEAKTVNKYMIVVWAGTDWSPKSREVTRAAEHLSKSSAEPVLWCVQDEREEMTEEEKKLPKPPGAVWNIPAIQVVSPDGHTVFLSEGVSRDTLPAVVKQAVEAVKQQNKADALWEKAAAASGANAAALYGEGLQQLPPYAARERKDILEKIRKADPEDTRGMHFKYTFNHLPYIEKVQRMVNDSAKDGGRKDYKAAHAYVDKQLKIPGMTPLQKQQVMAARFWLYRNEGKKDLALKTLKDIARISPKTLMGVGAQSYYRYLTEPVTLKEPRITGYYLRPEMTPTRVNIADMLNGPGNYKITFKMNSGGCSIRNPRFMRGTRVVSELPRDQQDKNGREFTLRLSGSEKPDLVFDCQGHGWFDVDCDIIVTKE